MQRRDAAEAARLAHRLGAWFHFICAQSILYGTAAARDDHAAALSHAQQMEWAAERTGDRRHHLYALSAQYVLEVERGRKARALAIESEMPLHSGFRDEFDCCVALATRLSWNGEFAEGYRILVTLDDRVVDPSERRLWNAALAMFAAFGGDEKNATLRLRACGRIAAPAARENAIGNVLADCFAAIAQIVLGHAEAAIRRLPHNAPTSQTRALASFARDLAALGSALGSESASKALQRLRSARQEGLADAVAAALASLRRDDSSELLTEAEIRVLVELAGRPNGQGNRAKARAQHPYGSQPNQGSYPQARRLRQHRSRGARAPPGVAALDRSPKWSWPFSWHFGKILVPSLADSYTSLRTATIAIRLSERLLNC